MRLDKYLKVSRLVKRRAVAKEMTDAGRVKINDRVAKPSTEVNPGDILEIGFGQKACKAKVLEVKETVSKDGAKDLYQLLSGAEID